MIKIAKRLLTGALVALATGSTGAVAASQPNILLIMADDLGFSDLASFGGEIETPNLDRLAAEGIRMTRFYVAATCSPSRAMLMTGMDNHQVGLGTMAEVLPFAPQLQGRPGYEGHLQNGHPTLPEVLQGVGYRTYMAGKWHLGKAPELDPSRKGFDRAFALLDGGASHFQPIDGSTVRVENVTYREDGKQVEVPPDFYSTDFYTDKLISYIDGERNSGHPFFAWAAYTAPHWPLHAPSALIAKYAGRYDAGYDPIREARVARQAASGLFAQNFPAASPRAEQQSWAELTDEQRAVESRKMEVYAAMVDHLDAGIGRLFDYLKRTGQYDNTVVVVISDNGAAAENHAAGYSPGDQLTDNSLANIGHRGSNVSYGLGWAEVSAAPFSLVKGTTGEGGISSPAIIRMPPSLTTLAGGSVVRQVARIDDLMPTLLKLAGVEVSADPQLSTLSGMPLEGVWSSETSATDRTLAGEMFGQSYVLTDRWKLRSAALPKGLPDMDQPLRWELFDLHSDRGERNNVASENPGMVQRLLGVWDDYRERMGLYVPEGGFCVVGRLEGPGYGACRE